MLAARRVGKHAGFWELPGGKVEPGESPTAALQREVREELGIDVSVGSEIASGFAIDETRMLHVYRCTLANMSATPIPTGSHDAIRWLMPGEWLTVEWLPVDRRAVIALCAQRVTHSSANGA